MARKFGYNIKNKRNREIFGPSWGQMALILVISLVLIGLLYWMFRGGGETEESATAEEQAQAEQPVQETTGQPAVEGECPLPSIPIVDFTKEDVIGDDSMDTELPESCKQEAEDAKRAIDRLYEDAVQSNESVSKAEQRLAEEISQLEGALEKLQTQQDNLDKARACDGEQPTTAENAAEATDNLPEETSEAPNDTPTGADQIEQEVVR